MNSKKKILFIGRFPPPVHGAAVMNEFYFNSLEIGRKFETDRVSINNKGDFKDIGRFSFKNLLWFIRSYLSFIKKMIFFRPNLVYFEIAPNGIAFYRDSLYVLLCKLFERDILFQIHARNLTRNFYSKFVFKDTKIIILSKLLIEEVEDLFDKKDIYFLPNGIPDKIKDAEFSEILKKRNSIKIPNLLFFSNMIEEKGTLDFLKICDDLKKKKRKFMALFAGSWPDDKTKKRWFSLREELGLKDCCVYLGQKFDEEKRKIFEKSHFMIFPTKYKNESFPLVILEAFMAGIPVLSYDQGAIKELISKDYMGAVFEKGKWEKMATELEKRIKNGSDYIKIRKHFKETYLFSVAEKNLAKIFEKELKEGK